MRRSTSMEHWGTHLAVPARATPLMVGQSFASAAAMQLFYAQHPSIVERVLLRLLVA